MASTSHGLAPCGDGIADMVPTFLMSASHARPSSTIFFPGRPHLTPGVQRMAWSRISQQQQGDGGPGWQKLWKAIAPPGAARHTSAGKIAMRLRAMRLRCGCARWTYSTSSARTAARLLLLPALPPPLLLLLPPLLAVPVLRAMFATLLLV